MTVTTIDDRTAVVVIDLQKGITGLPTVHPMPQVMDRAKALADGFRAAGKPVVWVNVDAVAPGRTETKSGGGGERPADWTEIADELGAQPGDLRVTKKRWGAFHGTALDLLLREHGVTQIVLGGVATGMGVESTARAASEHGYHVTLAVDAMTDMDAEIHRNSVERIFPRLGETGTTDDILALLKPAQ